MLGRGGCKGKSNVCIKITQVLVEVDTSAMIYVVVSNTPLLMQISK